MKLGFRRLARRLIGCQDPYRSNVQIPSLMVRRGLEILSTHDEVCCFFGFPSSEHRRNERPFGSAAHFPTYFDTDLKTLELLATLASRLINLDIVETGVANGVSTRAMLEAIGTDQGVTLHSFDTDPRCQDVVDDASRGSIWSFHALTSQNLFRELEHKVRPMSGRLGLWYHDSDHHYNWQVKEFKLAQESLAPSGFLVADDIDASIAFLEWALKNPTWKPIVLFDQRKFVGVAQKPGS